MRRLKAFFHIYKNSLLSIDYYKELFHVSTVFSVKYYLGLIFIVCLVLSTKLTVVNVPKARNAINDFAKTAKDMYPLDLVITVKDNKWSINKPEPFIIPSPVANSSDDRYKDMPQNFLVLYNEGTLEDLETYDTIALINSKNILLKEPQGIRTYPIEQLPDGEFHRPDFDGFIDNALHIFDTLPVFIGAGILLATFLYYALIQGSYVYTIALLSWVIERVAGLKHAFGDILQVAIHASTLPFTILVVTQVLNVSIKIPVWFSMLNFAFALIVLFKLGNMPKPDIGPAGAATSNLPENSPAASELPASDKTEPKAQSPDATEDRPQTGQNQ